MKYIIIIRDWLLKSLFILGSVFCFAMTTWLTLANKLAGATLMAGLFVVLVLMHYLPQMEYFKAYGIEAKWRQRISEADKILERLRSAAVVYGKLAYHVFGWGSRMSHPVRQKQAIADEVDALLKAADVGAKELHEIKSDYINFILVDITGCTREATSYIIDKQQIRFNQQIKELTNGDAEASDIEQIRNRQKRLLQESQRELRYLPTPETFQEIIQEHLTPKGLLDDDLEKAHARIVSQSSCVGTECISQGRLTNAAAQIIEYKNFK